MKNYDEITNNLLSRRDEFVKTRKKRIKIVVSATLSCIVLISALSVGIVKGGVFKTTPNGKSNITSNNSKTSSQNKKVIYVAGDTDDNYDNIINDGSLSLKEKYISPKLQEKMDLYKDYKDAEVIYRVIVTIRGTSKDYADYAEFEKNNKPEELVRAEKEYQVAWDKYQQAHDYFMKFGNANNPGWQQLFSELEQTYAAAKELERACEKVRAKCQSEYLQEIFAERIEEAAELSENEPELFYTGVYLDCIYNNYYIDLTAEEINTLAKKEGYYYFTLAPSSENGDAELDKNLAIDESFKNY